MAFSAKKLNDDDINNGNPYIDGSGFTPSDFNKAVEGILYLNGKVGSGSSGGTNITVDSALSTTSTNPVQNKVITPEINDLKTRVTTLESGSSGGSGGGTSITVDGFLDEDSPNPIQNRVVTKALNNKQDKLKAGTNITIAQDGTISATVASETGTTNYNDLQNKPSINGTTLSGDRNIREMTTEEVNKVAIIQIGGDGNSVLTNNGYVTLGKINNQSILDGDVTIDVSGGGTSGNAKIYLHEISLMDGAYKYYFYSTMQNTFCAVDSENSAILIPSAYVTTILGGSYFEYEYITKMYKANLFSNDIGYEGTTIAVQETTGFSVMSHEIIL